MTVSSTTSGGVYIETYGCQMNLADSEIVYSLLEERGYGRVETPEEASIILVNTCAIREHAQVKAISRVARFKSLKKKNPSLRVGVLGCLSKHASGELAEKLPFLDWIMGPDVYRRLPSLLLEPSPEVPLILKNGPKDELYNEVLPSRREGINAWVTITRGCNNHCTYCVVPYARGHERHRTSSAIIREVEEAVAEGFTQVTLLGQNVNSYEFDGMRFPQLLKRVSQIEGLSRVRYMTSHPKDCSEELINVMAEGGTICPELHLPVQAGNNDVLKRMNRKYTSEHYLGLVKMARERIPDLLLSTDLIVGFPGESDAAYQDTKRLIEAVGYDDAFVYKYSERPNTPSAKMENDVPEEVKLKRLMEINEIVRESGQRRRRALLGKTFPVLVEGPSKHNPDERMGRIPAGHVVVFKGEAGIGDEVPVKLDELSGFTLRGTQVEA